MSKSPFKFLDSYTKEDHDIFFGRETEVEELYQKVFESKILLVCGVSGTGKSSLIDCGLANKFEDSDWLPVNVRRGRNVVESLGRELGKVVLSDLKSAVGSPQSAKKNLTGDQIVKALQSIYLDHFKPIYLIFDQFEELFIFGDREEREEFIQIVKRVVDSDLQCKLLFVMREEYLAGAIEFEREIPTFLTNRLRIEKMTWTNAKHVIEEPCKVHGIKVEEGLAETILGKLSPESTGVELTYLQVLLDKLYHLSVEKSKEKPEFTNDLLREIGDVSDLLGSFLEDQIIQLEDPETGLTVLKSFVSVKGTKRQISEEEIIEFSQTLGNPVERDELKDLIQKFINLRILRDKDESGRYELRHDSLATKIYEKITLVEKEILEVRQFIDNAYNQYEKRKIYLTAKDLKYIAPYEDKLFINKETERFIKDSKSVLQKAKKKIKRIAIAGFFAILLISTGTIFRTFQLPLSAFIIYAGSILYIAWFLPLFSFYVFKTKENRTINLLFLMFTVIFLGTIYLYNTSVKRVLFKPVIITEQKLQNTIDNLGLKNVGLYNDINKLAEENPGTTGNYKSQAIQVNERTTELFNYIQDIKIEIVSITEGIEEDNLEENGINIESLRRIDENNIPAEILIGVDDNGKVFDLKAVIIDYKQFLSGIVEENPMIKESLERTLNTDDPIGSDENIGWERYNFEGLSLGFVITTLSKIQSEIKYAEMEVLSYLFEQMDNAIKEVVRRIPIVVVSSLKMNVFYIGVDNPVNIAVPGVDQDNITVSSSNGTITREQGYFNVRPTVLQDCNITVVAEIDNIHRAFPPIRFRVKNIPDPVATVGGINGGMIKKEDLLNAKGIKAAISSDFDFDIQFEVTGFQVGMSDRGFFVIAQASNSLFTEDQKKLIMRVKRNDRIMITNIQAVGPTGKTRDLNGIILQIIE